MTLVQRVYGRRRGWSESGTEGTECGRYTRYSSGRYRGCMAGTEGGELQVRKIF